MLPEDFGAGDGANHDEDDGAADGNGQNFDSLAVGLSGKEPINKVDGPFCNLIQKPVSSPHVKKRMDQVMVFLIQRIAHCTVTI